MAFASADVSGDGSLSVAELSRLMRGAALFATYEGILADRMRRVSRGEQGIPFAEQYLPFRQRVSTGALTGSALVAAFAGPSIARSIIDAYDYDADGALTLAEFRQDRVPFFDAPVGGLDPEAAAMTILQASAGAVAGFLPDAIRTLTGLVGRFP